MNLDEYRKEKEKRREEISRKVAAGQSLKEHLEEVSVFDQDLLKQSKITVVIDGEEIVIYPEGNKKTSGG